MRLYFYRGKGFWAALIRWFTRSKYAHVAIAFEDEVVYEAVPGKGVIKGPLRSIEGVTPFIFKTGNYIDTYAVRAFCENQLGTKYDYWGVICFIFGIKPRRSENRYFCSEFGADACAVGGQNLQERVESFKLSPDNLSWSAALALDYARIFSWQNPVDKNRPLGVNYRHD